MVRFRRTLNLSRLCAAPLIAYSATKEMNFGANTDHEFRKKNAVRIAFTGGPMRKHVADDLGVGKSILNRWITWHCDTDVVSK